MSYRGVTLDDWPEQGDCLGLKAEVMFKGDSCQMTSGIIVRDDIQMPFYTIIELEDGRFVMGHECQYAPIKEEEVSHGQVQPRHRND